MAALSDYSMKTDEIYRDKLEEVKKKLPARKLTLEILKSFDSDDINEYVKDYLTKYEHEGKVFRNDYNGKARKLAAVKSMYKYFLSKEKIDKDPTALVTLKTKSEYEIVYLQPNEVADLLDCIDDGEALIMGVKLREKI